MNFGPYLPTPSSSSSSSPAASRLPPSSGRLLLASSTRFRLPPQTARYLPVASPRCAVWPARPFRSAIGEIMADYGHDLQFGFFLDPATDNPVRTIEIAHILEDLGYDLIGIQDHPYQPNHFDAMALIAFLLGQTARIRIFP